MRATVPVGRAVLAALLRRTCPLCWLCFSLQVKWGADFLINSHVDDYVYMGSMGNATEGGFRLAAQGRGP